MPATFPFLGNKPSNRGSTKWRKFEVDERQIEPTRERCKRRTNFADCWGFSCRFIYSLILLELWKPNIVGLLGRGSIDFFLVSMLWYYSLEVIRFIWISWLTWVGIVYICGPSYHHFSCSHLHNLIYSFIFHSPNIMTSFGMNIVQWLR